LENLKERILAVDGRKTLKWILKKQDVRVWAGFSWLRIGYIGGNETSGYINAGNFLTD
jgi:hypothetical protein